MRGGFKRTDYFLLKIEYLRNSIHFKISRSNKDSVRRLPQIANHQLSLEAISKKGFGFKIAAGPSFKPQEYISISRI